MAMSRVSVQYNGVLKGGTVDLLSLVVCFFITLTNFIQRLIKGNLAFFHESNCTLKDLFIAVSTIPVHTDHSTFLFIVQLQSKILALPPCQG
ncbi:hypothetical protein EXN66_Car007257 [Channa argus]|uniref:Uncharacterized protein n=1 Tax=Channa argus TaxID=215402 RepID=A0A6G1PMU0_CHAAH|nr:hypothetical protein EXN66_Car007257 [Channa argus]